MILLCGRYEGVDQRVIEARAMQEVSIGDYVLSGGELAALVLLDATVRLLPGVMGAADSAAEESFSHALLEYPHYTRPAEWQGRRVPERAAVRRSRRDRRVATGPRRNGSPASAVLICEKPMGRRRDSTTLGGEFVGILYRSAKGARSFSGK